MNDRTVASLIDQSARGLSRRASLATLGATGLAAMAAPLVTEAKRKKKCKKKDKKCPSLEEICAPQVAECEAIVAAVCGTDPECDQIVACCDVLADCDAGAFLLCLDAPS